MPLKSYILNCGKCGKRVKIRTNNSLLFHTDRQKRNTFVICHADFAKLSPLQKQDHKRDYPAYIPRHGSL